MPTKKELILESALELFCEKGFSATTTKEIANRSGVAEGLIFYHFKDKNTLLRQLTQRYSFVGSIQEEMKTLGEWEPYQALKTFGEIYVNFLSSNKKFLLFVWSPEMITNHDISDELGKALISMRDFASDLLQKMIRVPIDKQDLALSSSMFLSTLMTFVLVQGRMLDSVSIETDQYVKKVLDKVVNGLKPK
ncbi:TetR/AcrR family transcriptional regulator [Terrilactibacillus laevilacticus]|uniref:TetR/AcrR family transcriptional regulator n=1 Tax=Terrilactibacillus laevilacticus TaxID=1380157 RepID=A0ABW5PSG2_9BACI|nr:TetR/AcrR family transcriptional regulator [Terrilactibacillus laevilacticus]